MHPIETAYQAAQVTRYHSHPALAKPTQTTGAHTAGMLAMLYHLNPTPSALLVKAIVYHDNPELFGGDLSYGFKKSHPSFAAEHEKLSQKLAADAGQILTPLSNHDKKWLELLDRLESIMFVKIHAPHILEQEKWRKLTHDVIDLATHLGCWEGKLSAVLTDDREAVEAPAPKDEDVDVDEDQLRIDLLDMVMNDGDLMMRLGISVTHSSDIGVEVMQRHLGAIKKDIEAERSMRNAKAKADASRYSPGPRATVAERPVMTLTSEDGKDEFRLRVAGAEYGMKFPTAALRRLRDPRGN